MESAGDLPATMPAVVLAGAGEIRVEERRVPEPGPRDVLIEVDACGICGTDLHLALEGWGAPGTVPGHEYAGRIAAVGDEAGVDPVLRVGLSVTANPQPECGTCDGCRSGRPALCREVDFLSEGWQGGFARYVRVAASQVHPLPEGLPMRVGALAEPLAVGLHALTQAGVEAGHRVLVTGAGPLGLLVVAALRTRGISDVVVSEPVRARRLQASQVGAWAAVAPQELPDPLIPPQIVDDPFDVVLECAGKPAAVEAGLKNLRPGGRLVIVGAGLEPVPLDPTRTMMHELEVVGTVNYDADGFDRALDLLVDGALDLEHLVEPETVPLDGFLAACQDLAAGRTSRKVLVTPA